MRKFGDSGLEEEHGADRNAKKQRLCVPTEGFLSASVASGGSSVLKDGSYAPGGLLSTLGGWDSDSDAEDLPCDTLAAILLLKSEFELTREVDSVVYPVVLKTQLYSIVENRTTVDREVDVLRHERKIRCFKLGIGPDEYAMMLADDYERELRDCSSGRATLSRDDHGMFGKFVEKVLPQVEDVSVSHDDLLACLSGANLGGFPQGSIKPKHDAAADSGVSALLNEGFLTRTSEGRRGYYFSSPSVGKIISSVVKGRKEIVGLLNRKRKHPEMFERDLLGAKCKLKQSILAMKFHLRDLVGKRVLVEMKTTRGLVLRVANRVL